MARRIPVKWWPGLILASPILAPYLVRQKIRFDRNQKRAYELNRERLAQAAPLDLPAVETLTITVLVDWMHKADFLGAPGVSCLFRTDQGALLYDIGFGVSSPTFTHNVAQLHLDLAEIDALAISRMAIIWADLKPSAPVGYLNPTHWASHLVCLAICQRPQPLRGGRGE